jgi:aarF domain-containing kinase
MMILDNHLHADMHPGNIFITFQKIPESLHEDIMFLPEPELCRLNRIQDPEEWKREMNLLAEDYAPYLVYVDAGLTSQLSPRHLSNFIDLLKAITDFDGALISHLMVTRSKYPDSVRDFEGFSRAMQLFMDDIKASTFKLKNIQVTDILSFVLHTVRKYHVKIDGDYANVAVAIMLLEGIGRQLEPDMDLLKAAVPFLQEAIRTRIEGDISTTEKSIWAYGKDFVKSYGSKFSF